LINRIIEPSSGEVIVKGRVAGLLELGSGFHPDLSGRENIYLNASILGIPRKVIQQRIADILEFADIGPFIDMPVRNYSTGMAMRLGFAISTALDPDILLIDEVLAVGDQAFQQKCLERLDQLRANGVTIVFVSHSLEYVQRLCRRAMWLDNGVLCADGEAERVIGQYLDAVSASDVRRYLPKTQPGIAPDKRWGTYQAEITAVEMLDRDGVPRQAFLSGDFFRLRLHYQARVPIDRPAFGMAIYRRDGLHLNGPNTVLEGYEIERIDGCGYVDYIVERLPLAAGHYELTAVIYDHNGVVAHDHHHRLHPFEVRDRLRQREEGIIHIPAVWQHVPRP
jgi:ABC-type polysaccharide/polyol phosphate transport system ATPase subunit